jgi:SAM-dependent methyltransferase
VYGTKADIEVSWYQLHPATSLRLIRAAAPDPATGIIDVGCGTSTLVDELLAAGYHDLAALDVSAAAIDRARGRVGLAGAGVEWIVADITRWQPQRQWGLWHDRAVFHFLTEPTAQDAYIRNLEKALAPAAAAIIATFALDGPEKCSGLPVQRYSAPTLARRLGPGFRLVSDTPERHTTPRGDVQSFMYAVFERR